MYFFPPPHAFYYYIYPSVHPCVFFFFFFHIIHAAHLSTFFRYSMLVRHLLCHFCSAQDEKCKSCINMMSKTNIAAIYMKKEHSLFMRFRDLCFHMLLIHEWSTISMIQCTAKIYARYKLLWSDSSKVIWTTRSRLTEWRRSRRL